jgi:hypothetical protein
MVTLKQVRRLFAQVIILVTALLLNSYVNLLTLTAQPVLPVKDFSVGNMFVYLYGSAIVEERILSDTAIGSVRYAVVQTRFFNGGVIQSNEQYFMRSNDTAIYQYLPSVRRDTMLYRFGQRCSGSSLPWAITENNCSATLATVSTSATYQERAYAVNNSGIFGSDPRVTNTIDPLYAKKTVYYAKPFGIVRDSSISCEIGTSASEVICRISSPPGCVPRLQFFLSLRCQKQTGIRLLRAVIRGEEFLPNPLVYTTSWVLYQTENSTNYSSLRYLNDSLKIQLLCKNAETGVPAFSEGIKQLRCVIPIDTSLVRVSDIQTTNGPKPDSVSFANGKLILYCTFSTDRPANEYITLRPKALTKDSTLFVSFDASPVQDTNFRVGAVFRSTFMSVSLLRKVLRLTYAYRRERSLFYGQTGEWEFGLYKNPYDNKTFISDLGLPPQTTISCTLDTTGVDAIQIVNSATGSIITPQTTRSFGMRTEFIFSVPTTLLISSNARLRLRSTSLRSSTATISFSVVDPPAGFQSLDPYSFVYEIKHLGLGKGVPDSIAKTLFQGKTIVHAISPNPTSDDFVLQIFSKALTATTYIDMVNTLGATIFSASIPARDAYITETQINSSTWSPGIYLVRVRTDSDVSTSRVFITR